MSEIAIIDCQIAGISGDMFLSALIDAGAERKRIIDLVYSCADFFEGCTISSVDFSKVKSSGVSCTKFILTYEEKSHSVPGSVFYQKISRCCDSIDLDAHGKGFVMNSVKSLIHAESVVHGTNFNEVTLHETGRFDTIVDLVGTAAALNDLNLFSSKIYSTNVAVGKGTFDFSHGIVPNPGNAILEIFKGKGFTLTAGPLNGEVTTPTGAAMLVNLASPLIDGYPPFIPIKIGYGGASKEYPGIPNVVRISLGKIPLGSVGKMDSVYELETNVDDVSGEVVGNIIETLYSYGAVDVTILQGITKKNRPVLVIKVLSDKLHLEVLTNALFSETGTLGVRVHETYRFALERSTLIIPVTINSESFRIHVKISKNVLGKINSVKPEYEDVKAVSKKLHIPFKKSAEILQRKISNNIGNGDL